MTDRPAHVSVQVVAPNDFRDVQVVAPTDFVDVQVPDPLVESDLDLNDPDNLLLFILLLT